MTITETIDKTNWDVVVSGNTGNPTATAAILDRARRHELLVVSDGHLFAPIEEPNSWKLEEVLTEDQVVDLLQIPLDEAHLLLANANVEFFTRVRPSSTQNLWIVSDLTQKLEQYTASQGMPPEEAALELGLTLATYTPLMSEVRFQSKNKVLKPLLEAFRNKFLPRHKIWSSRTSLLKEFVENYNRATPKTTISIQPCDVDNCDHVASAQCVNPMCRDRDPRRFVCPAHEEWVDIANIWIRPPALCPSCADKSRNGKLHEFPLL